jgi:hypothetical protein
MPMDQWIDALLAEQHCMDCKAELAEDEGTMEFQGTPPHVEFIGRLCFPCWTQRETIRRVRSQPT